MARQALICAGSWLLRPATRPERFAKAASAGADLAILDLEDAVAPKGKAHARTRLSLIWRIVRLTVFYTHCASTASNLKGLSSRARGCADRAPHP